MSYIQLPGGLLTAQDVEQTQLQAAAQETGTITAIAGRQTVATRAVGPFSFGAV